MLYEIGKLHTLDLVIPYVAYDEFLFNTINIAFLVDSDVNSLAFNTTFSNKAKKYSCRFFIKKYILITNMSPHQFSR